MSPHHSRTDAVTVAVVWRTGPVRGTLEVSHGTLEIVRGGAGALGGEPTAPEGGCATMAKGTASGNRFRFPAAGPCRLEVAVTGKGVRPLSARGSDPFSERGVNAAIVAVKSETNPFSFFLRDVDPAYPIFMPDYGVAVTAGDDPRSYEEIAEAVRRRGLASTLQRIEMEPEETCAQAAAATRAQHVPTWLGLSRDMRTFEVDTRGEGSRFDRIKPRFHGCDVNLPECEDKAVQYEFLLGRGWSCVEDITRHLEDGVLPILHGTVTDDDVAYQFMAFVTLERSPLTAENLRGTHFLVADGHGRGHMFTAAQQQEYDRLLPGEVSRDEETVLFFRTEAVNTAAVPCYAWFAGLFPAPRRKDWTLDADGFGLFPDSGRVFAVEKLNGRPMPQKEVAVLLAPGETATFEFRLPHQPIDRDRAAHLAAADFDERHRVCRAFWLDKLAAGASVSLPEKRIDEMVRAGLTHLDLVAYGLEPDGPIAATIGVYCPIGSESSPIIQFLDCVRRHDVAERALEYFLEKQHEDGFIQNFGGYMLETGPVLWSMGEHYRLTRDDAWVRRIAPKVRTACEFMIRWRKRSMTDEFVGKGYGLQAGKTADPEDPFHSFMLNGYAYLGLSRAAEMLAAVDPEASRRLATEAAAFREDIRAAFFETVARSPVVPLGDGTWVPTCAPWTEDRGALALFAGGAPCTTHGAVCARDSLLGPVYLIFQEVLQPDETAADHLLNWHAELMCTRNVAFSQPYYSRHPSAHLRRGEVKAFLKAYYNGLAGLADRQTYTFWEHYFHASPHKTHEEGWFLMQTRWMLWMEYGRTLRLLPGIPRAWLEDGQRIELMNVATYFGSVTLAVESHVDLGFIEATVTCPGDRQPEAVEVRLPHPRRRRATAADGGTYDPVTETVLIRRFRDRATVRLRFGP